MAIETLTSGVSLKGVSLGSLLEQQARIRPYAIAVTAVGRDLTFAELAFEAHRTGALLSSLGALPDTCVGLFTEPSADLVTGAWGILTAGAAYLPLSPEYPDDRLRYMIESSGTRVIVTQEHLRERLRGLAPEGTAVVTASDAPEAQPGPLPAAGGEHLAYVIYTSGSTGRPKGVMIEQRSVVSQLQWLANCGHLGPRVSILQKTPMSFDAAQWEILAAAVGARVVMGTPGIYRDPEAVIDMIAQHRVTALQAVPTLLRALIDTERLGACGSLHRIFSGGEALTTALARDLFEAVPGVSLVNLYGPTETTINATSHWVDPAGLGERPGGMLPVGVPADRVTCYILDESRRPVDIGETGELFVGGRQVARGYIGLPEETERRFITSPFNPTERLYRTGDLCQWNEDGTIQFTGRTDNQVKLRGYRVELEEVAARIEEHTWVRRAAALVADDPRTKGRTLVAAVELNERTAATMDQGREDADHHRSKASKLQVKAQLSNPGLREDAELGGRPVVALPGSEPGERQRREAFARKTYRFYGGGPVGVEDLLGLLAARPEGVTSRSPQLLSLPELGEILRWLGPFRSQDRLLPKYAYASPGALYATQLYLETPGLPGLPSGLYYHHPVEHTLVRVGEAAEDREGPLLRLHFLGKRRAIEPVYKNNIAEVLELEAGHMLGVLEEVLPDYGLGVEPAGYDPRVKRRMDVVDEDLYLGGFDVAAYRPGARQDGVELFVQAHGDRVAGLAAGFYRYRDGALEPLGTDVVEKRHVIAINQGVYERAAFGISAVSRAGTEPWLRYVLLGTALHRLQRVPGFGLMSSGYSSKTGNPLPAATRLDDLLAAAGAEPAAASYFFVGGRVTPEQAAHQGMDEDAVHTKGPAEMIREELAKFLPSYMIPARVLVVPRLPLTANGKTDARAAAALPELAAAWRPAPYVAPATDTERWLAAEWGGALGYEDVSVRDEFFASGGNSLHAVALVNRINREFGTSLPLQVLFESPELGALAARIDEGSSARETSRLVPLRPGGSGRPVFCWPGLGGYPMNLRGLGREARLDGPFYGVQAHGINADEEPYPTIGQMALADLEEIRAVQPSGPYRLWGYSFGARVAFEAAYRLEQAGERVEHLMLICPGNPALRSRGAGHRGRDASFANPAYVTILFSVFAGAIEGRALDACLDRVTDEDSFVRFVHEMLPALDAGTIRRVTRIVGQTYEFDYTFRELRERRLTTPITVFKAQGDDYSFIESSEGYSAAPPTVVELKGDHYSVLKDGGVAELAERIASVTGG
ncbi:non-ribosomal peptide synthetase family protein [Streptomyces fuscigenes]|uniref:non-ribosomal peptide synthetase family protein n=1 Tax=Streptomyces fuscigenes TaxID=1528880 RepID=UPI001F489B66|nr:amino acid adenylation domain-containing protein [Streptomyces fuscigenes]MCF3961015.1 amino acid adenylation domain-containing protein [Streptomyces fuscigenes]